MSSRRTSSVPKEDVVFPRMLYCDSRCSQTLTGLSLALPGALLYNATRRLGDRQRVILRQRVRGSVRAIRAVWNTRVFQTETRVVADDESLEQHGSPWKRTIANTKWWRWRVKSWGRVYDYESVDCESTWWYLCSGDFLSGHIVIRSNIETRVIVRDMGSTIYIWIIEWFYIIPEIHCNTMGITDSDSWWWAPTRRWC